MAKWTHVCPPPPGDLIMKTKHCIKSQLEEKKTKVTVDTLKTQTTKKALFGCRLSIISFNNWVSCVIHQSKSFLF